MTSRHEIKTVAQHHDVIYRRNNSSAGLGSLLSEADKSRHPR